MSDHERGAELLRQARAEYLVRLPEQLALLAGMAEDESGDAAALGKLRTLAHRVHGTAGSYGFAAVSEVAGRLETLAQAAGEGTPDRAALRAIAAELRALPLG